MVTDCNIVFSAIEESGFQIDEIVCGEARGVDSLGRRYGEKNNIPIKSFPAEWDIYGKSAGYVRNGQMGNYATHLILIWDGESRGSASMLKIAQKRGLTIFQKIVKYSCVTRQTIKMYL